MNYESGIDGIKLDPLPARSAPLSSFLIHPSSFPPCRVAVFDTDEDMVFQLADALRGEGFSPVHAAVLDDHAREILRENAIDLLVGSDRLKHFTEVRRLNPAVRIIALTVDGRLPRGGSAVITRSADRVFSHQQASIRDIVAACGVLRGT